MADDTLKEQLQRTITALNTSRELAEKITDKPVRNEALNNIDNHLMELERLTFTPDPDHEAERTITNALTYLEELMIIFSDYRIKPPD